MDSNTSIRSKKTILLCIDVIAIVLSFVLSLAIRFRLLVENLGSKLVMTTYIPFFVVTLLVYIIIMAVRTDTRIDRMAKREILEITVVQQIILTVIYISIFFLFHEADAISRIVVGLFFIFNVLFCIMGRIAYHEYCVRNKTKTYEENKAMSDAGDADSNGKVRHLYIVGDREIIGSTPKNPVIMRDG